MKREEMAVGYVRCSTVEQEDSINQQKKEVRKYADINKFTIVEWFEDMGVSGTTFDRPGFNRLLERVQKGADFGAVICYDQSRWGRGIDPEENVFWRHLFKRENVNVKMIKTSIDENHEYAPMLNAFDAVQASQYSKKLADLTFRGAMSNGKYSNGGTPPYGYIRIAVSITDSNVKKTLNPGDWCTSGKEKVLWAIGDPGEVEVVKLIFVRRQLGTACVLIAKELNDNNIPCPRRGRWRNKNQQWSSSTIRSIIVNHAYYGARVYNKNSMSKIFAAKEGRKTKNVKYPHYINDKAKWVIEEDAHPPIVTKEEWLKANSVKQHEQKGTKERGDVKNLLTSIIRCKDCGNPYYGNPSTSKGTRIERYVCSGFTRKRVCPFCSVRKDEVEYYVEKQIQSVMHHETFENAIKEVLDHYLNERPSKNENQSETLNARLKKLESEESNLIQSIAHGVDPKLVGVELTKLNKEKIGINDRLKELQIVTSNQAIKDQIRKEVELFLLTYPSEIENLPLHRKRMLFKIFTKEVLVSRKNKTVEFLIRRIPTVHPILHEIEQEAEKNTNAQGIPGQLWDMKVAGEGLEPTTYGL